MSYITVRGNLGTTQTIINGLEAYELDQLSEYISRGPKIENADAVLFFNPVMKVINQLESMFGYEVVSCNNTPTLHPVSLHNVEQTMWLMHKNDVGHQQQQYNYHDDYDRRNDQRQSGHSSRGRSYYDQFQPRSPIVPPASALPTFITFQKRRQSSIPDRVSFGNTLAQLEPNRLLGEPLRQCFTPKLNTVENSNNAVPWYTRNIGHGQHQSVRPIQRRERISQFFRPGPRTIEKDEFVLYNASMYVANQLEYHLGYRIIMCTQFGEDQVVWTLFKAGKKL